MARREFNLKLVVIVETERDPRELQARLDGLFETAKTRVRTLCRNLNPPVQILEWHYHTSTGPVTDPEP